MLKWLAVPFMGMIGIIFSVVVGSTVFTIVNGKWIELYVAPFAAFLFVFLGAYVAPKNNSFIALLLYLSGCVFSFFYFGESIHPINYTFTYIPLIIIFISGFFGVVIIKITRKT